uniref:WDFY family member 4 n=1 Tax=Hucho hucho TaxID=62062 RepID=A0A4W5QEA5_9TELE
MYVYIFYFSTLSSAKNCVRICIQNLQRISDRAPAPVLAEVAVTVFSFIRDSYQLNPALFTELENNDGYTVLQGVPAEEFGPVEDLLSLLASLCLFGRSELKVALCVTNPQPPGFKFDPSLTTGSAVRNLSAFRLLQGSFQRSEDCVFCSQILSTIRTVWSWNRANFFLLEWTVQSLAQLAQCVSRKPPPVHRLFFSMLEMSTPVYEACDKSNLIGFDFSLKSTKSLLFILRLTVHSGLLAEVLSDGGLLELLLGELRRRAKILRKARGKCYNLSGTLILISLQLSPALSLSLSPSLSVSVRDLGMVPYIKIFLDEGQYRGPTLSILEQLSEINPDEFMSTAIGALCSSTQQELGLKQDLLQSVLKILESPNSWGAFRRARGFTGLLSLVVDMEGALSDPPKGGVWGAMGQQGILDLLFLTLHTLALAVHVHPVNSHQFQAEGFYERLAEALLRLGCFQTEGQEATERMESRGLVHTSLSSTSKPPLPPPLQTCIRLLSYLDQLATGTYAALEMTAGHVGEKREEGGNGETQGGGGGGERLFTCDQTILHPGALRVIMTLLPHVFTAEDPQLSVEVQYSVAHHLQVMVTSEKNRQIVCEGGLVSTLLTHCRSILLRPDHPLYLPDTRILEKISSHSISHIDLRSAAFLGTKLGCHSPEETDSSTDSETTTRSIMKTLKRSFSLLSSSPPIGSPVGQPIPLHQIISLVSMTSPRSFRPHRVSTSPAFVEFDMSENCRGFPPAAGLSYSCWFLISRFSSACDSHPIWLLSVVRHMSRAEQQYVCLSVSISASDGCLVISTEEEPFTFLDMMEPEVRTPSPLPGSLRFKCSSQLTPGQWHHLAIVMAKDVKKSCKVTAHLNGKLVGAAKMLYIQPFPGQYVSMDPTAVIDVCAFIGTPSLWKQHASLVWRIGPTYLFEEVLSPGAVGAIYNQGTAYLGNYLALRSGPDPLPLRLVPEERISFGINPAVATLTTVAEIRESYNEVDCRLIAKEMGITSRDNSTPVFLSQNISHHLTGTARTIGAALVGHFGVRTFAPSSAGDGFLYLGGPAVILSLVAMAADDGALYAAVKVLLSVLETSPAMEREMTRINGYKVGTTQTPVIKVMFIRLQPDQCGSVINCCLLSVTSSAQTVFSLQSEYLQGQTSHHRVNMGFNGTTAFLTYLIYCVCVCVSTCSEQKELIQTLGSDWFLLFLQPRLHSSTLCLGLRLLTLLLANQSERNSFREGVFPGTLVESLDEPSVVIGTIYFCLDTVCFIRSSAADASWELKYPGSVMQFLCLVHNHRPRDPLWTSPEFLHTLASTVFPLEVCVFLLYFIFLLPEGQMATLMENMVFFSQKFLEKLYSGMFLVEPENLLTFLADQIVVVLEKGLSKKENTVSSLYTSTNRALLYFLSRPQHTQAEQEAVIRTLRLVMVRWDVVMATYNANVNFITCLLHCLLLIRSGSYPEGFGFEIHKKHQRRILSHLFPLKTSRTTTLSQILTERRTILEDTYKIELSANQTQRMGPVSMSDISPLWEETALKVWQLYTGETTHMHGHRQTSLRYTYRIETAFCRAFLSSYSIPITFPEHNFTFLSLSLLQLRVCEWERLGTMWLRVEEELLRERGVFGPGPGVVLTRGWVQDAAEGPNRTRPRIRRRAQRCSKRVLALTVYHSCLTPNCISLCSLFVSLSLYESIAFSLFLSLSMRFYILKAKVCVVVVSGLSVTEGLLLFGRDSLYMCEGFTLTPAGDVCCRKHHHTGVRDAFLSSMLTKDIPSSSPSCKRWPYQDIRDVHFMRFLLEENALEIFMQNGYSAFLVFFNKDHVSAFKRLCSVVPALIGRGVAEVITNRGEISNFEYLMHLNTLAGRTYSDLMQYPVFPWVLADYKSETLDLTKPATFRDLSKPMGAQTEKRRDMFIQRFNEVENSEGDLAVRCHYCTHYSSAIIVSSFLVRMEPFSHTFLTLQGGYDIAERMFHSVKKDWDSASRDNMSDVRELIPEFYYLPDFLVNTNHFKLGCMQDGTILGDVVLPPWAKGDPQEFIRVHREALESEYVSSHLHLWIDLIFGHCQQGPAAVESLNTFHPYFYAQRRKGTGGQDALRDPLIKSTIQGYVNNFGQVPKQLFNKPHPPRAGSKKEGGSGLLLPPSIHISISSSPHPFSLFSSSPSELLRGPVGQVVCVDKEVLVVEKNRLLIPPLWNVYFSWGFPDNSCSFGHYTTEKTFAVCESVCDWGEMLCAACPNQATIVTAGTSSVVCVWDVSISKDKLTHMKLRQALYGHIDAVTCLAVSEVHGVIASGSRDLTCILWDLEELNYITQLPGHKASITALAINDLTGEIASCAGPVLYLWSMKGQLLTWLDTSCGSDVTSCSSDGDILSVCFTQRHEWDPRNVIVTGCADGIVRVRETECHILFEGIFIHICFSVFKLKHFMYLVPPFEGVRSIWTTHLKGSIFGWY